MSFQFGIDAPCRACHGAGERVIALTKEEKSKHLREQRIAKKNGYTLERVPVTKPCPDCAGNGYVPIAVADARRDQ